MHRPLVSILINNYNYERFLSDAIDGALRQTYSPVEVIVVDDGSTDNSRDVIASYGSNISFVFKNNGGQASAFNTGIAASRGDIMCFLDADDFFYPEKVERVVQIFNQSNLETEGNNGSPFGGRKRCGWAGFKSTTFWKNALDHH